MYVCEEIDMKRIAYFFRPVPLIFSILQTVLDPPKYLDFACNNRGVCVLNEHLNVLVKPLSSPRRTFKSAASVALTTGLDPDDGIDMSVVDWGAGLHTKAGRADVAPLTPLLPAVGNTALVNDEARRQTLSFKMRGKGESVVVLVP